MEDHWGEKSPEFVLVFHFPWPLASEFVQGFSRDLQEFFAIIVYPVVDQHSNEDDHLNNRYQGNERAKCEMWEAGDFEEIAHCLLSGVLSVLAGVFRIFMVFFIYIN